MALVALNRILIVLGYVGLFVSGFLSLSHLLKISLPCGPTKGCDTVATHATSYLVGNSIDGGFPVAYLGFLGYLFLTAIAVYRSIKGVDKSRSLIVIGFIASAVGALYSGYLTYVSLYVIHATCVWCLTSAMTMILTTLVYAAMLQAEPKGETSSKVDPLLAGVLTVVLGIGLAGGSSYLKNSGEMLSGDGIHKINTEKIPLVGENSHILGDPNAPVTIIEFADLLCPTCQSTYPVLEDLVKNSNGKIRLVFHHFPLFQLQDHKMALPAATMAEMAAEESKFWQFISAIYSKQHADLQTTEALLGVAQSVGLDVNKIQERMGNGEDPAVKRVTDDLNLANQIKIRGTPTLFIQAKGGEVEGVTNSKLEEKLNEEPYRSLIKGGGSGS